MALLGLDQPLWKQYLNYINGVLHGDLGISLKSRIPVWDEFVPRFKATLELGICAMIFAVAIGIPVGVMAAVKRGSIFDHTAVGISLTGYSMPIFWWGIMLIMLVSVQLNLTPVSGRVGDTVFLDDTMPLTGFMLIDTFFWGAGRLPRCGDAHDPACHRARHHSAGGDCANDAIGDARSAG